MIGRELAVAHTDREAVTGSQLVSPTDVSIGTRQVHTTGPAGAGWGSFPALALVAAVGLLLVALADTGARSRMPWAEALFWVGLVVMFAPIATRLASARALPRERLALVVSLGLGLYGVKVLQNPLYFTYFDELLHLRTAQDIVRSGRLFSDNPLLLVGPYYPGLETVVTALSAVTGLTIFAAAITVLAVARLVLVLALYLLYQRISGSARVASIASALYMANPHFLFFDAAFAYESLALAFAALTLVAVARRRAPGGNGIGFGAVIVVALGASIITHHVTSAFLVGFLGLWAATSRFSRQLTRSAVTTCPTWPALLGSAAVVVWALLVATPVVDYLAGPAFEVADTVRRLVGSSDAAAEALGTLSRPVQRPWERFAGYLSMFLILSVLSSGLLQVWRRQRANAAALATALVGLGYPVSLPLRVSRLGAEVAGRASAFMFIGLAYVLALVAVKVWPVDQRGWRRPAVALGSAVLLLVGGVIVGTEPDERMPGPYLVGADARSVEPEGIAAATWARAFLGPDNRIASDRTNGLLMLAHGAQRPVTGGLDHIGVSDLFLSREVGSYEQGLIRTGGIEYLVVDRRLSTGVPLVGVYFEEGEADAFQHEDPMHPEMLAKFDTLPRASRIFDSGQLVIYDVRALLGAPALDEAVAESTAAPAPVPEAVP